MVGVRGRKLYQSKTSAHVPIRFLYTRAHLAQLWRSALLFRDRHTKRNASILFKNNSSRRILQMIRLSASAVDSGSKARRTSMYPGAYETVADRRPVSNVAFPRRTTWWWWPRDYVTPSSFWADESIRKDRDPAGYFDEYDVGNFATFPMSNDRRTRKQEMPPIDEHSRTFHFVTRIPLKMEMLSPENNNWIIALCTTFHNKCQNPTFGRCFGNNFRGYSVDQLLWN